MLRITFALVCLLQVEVECATTRSTKTLSPQIVAIIAVVSALSVALIGFLCAFAIYKCGKQERAKRTINGEESTKTTNSNPKASKTTSKATKKKSSIKEKDPDRDPDYDESQVPNKTPGVGITSLGMGGISTGLESYFNPYGKTTEGNELQQKEKAIASKTKAGKSNGANANVDNTVATMEKQNVIHAQDNKSVNPPTLGLPCATIQIKDEPQQPGMRTASNT